MDKSKLLSHISDYYINSTLINDILNVNAIELTSTQESIINTLNQFFLLDADTSLSHWEKEFGIVTNKSLSNDERRKKVLSKLRGLNTSTLAQIKSICLSYVEQANIIENNADYSFTIELISHVGFPKFITDLFEILSQIKPAHLNVNYKLNSLTNDDLLFRTTMVFGEIVQVYPSQIDLISTIGQISIKLGNTHNAEIISVDPYHVSNISTKGDINIALGNTHNAEIISVNPL